MDFQISSSFMFLLSFLLFLATLSKIIQHAKPKPKPGPRMNLPPGPRKLPLIGNLHQLLSTSQLPHQTLRDLALKHGPIMHLQLGEISTVVITSPDGAEEVLKTHDTTFANRPSFLATEILFYKNSDIAFSPYSEYWRQLRKICALELFSIRRVQSFQTLREEETLKMCRWIASKQGSSINLTNKITKMMCDIVMQASLGNKSDELATFASTIKETSDLIGGFYVADLFPSIKPIQLFSGIRGRAERLHKICDRILENIINDHRVSDDHERKGQEDLVDVLLKFNTHGHKLFLTTDNIKAVIQDIFNGGIETSSSTIDWAMAELLKHPSVLKKAQDEIRHVFSNKGFVDESELEGLKYLKSVIKETLRMHPAGPLLAPRENSEHCKIQKYDIPAKTRVMVNAWAIGRDPRHWEDANCFIPERFLDSSIDFKGSNYKYLPFGGGRRICPGMSFGLANVELPLAMLLYHFNWALPDGISPENLDMTEYFGITVGRKHPLHVIPTVERLFSC